MPTTIQGRPPGLEAPTGALRQATIDKLAYVLPKVEKSVLNDALSPDVVAEWSGITPTLPPTCDIAAAGSPTSKGKQNTSFDGSLPERTTYPDRSAALKRQNDVLEYPIDRDALLFHPEMKLLCQLNETAYFIWRNCDGRGVEELAAMLTDAFHVETDTATDHVMRIIELFSISGFVAEESLHAVPS